MSEARTAWQACACGFICLQNERGAAFALKVIGQGDHALPYLSESERRDLIRRVPLLLNAADGIPTETLEAGVVVVPAEVAAVLADEVRRIAESLREFCGVQRDEATPGWLAHWEKRVQAWATLADALSRLQQNGTSSNPANMPVLKLMADAEQRQREASDRFLAQLGLNGGADHD